VTVIHLLTDTAVPSSDWASILAQGGAGVVLAAAVIAFVKGWIVPGTAYREVCSQRDRAVDLVYKLADQQQQQAEITQRLTEIEKTRSGR